MTKAPAIPSWHEPLARRPTLPPRIIHKLTDFLAASLLQTLQNRGDLDAETAKAVAAALHNRLQQEDEETIATEINEREAAEEEDRNLRAKGKLDEEAVAKAVGEGRHFFVTEALGTETDAYPMDEDAMRLQLDSFHATT